MSLPTLTGEFRISRDIELKYSQSGVAVARIGLVANSRKRQDDGTWVDDKVVWVNGTAFKKVAENAAHSLNKGDLVVVSGKLETQSWEKEGEKKSATALLIDFIGPSLTFDAAQKVEAPTSGAAPSGDGNPWAEPDDSSPPF